MSEPVRFSNLKRIALSPAHYKASLTEHVDSPAMRLGRLVHHLVLGGNPFVVWEGDRRGKAWLEFKEANDQAEIATRSEADLAGQIALSVAGSDVAAPFLVGKREHAVKWTTMGRACSTMGIDLLGDGFITELKTASCTEPERFRRAALSMGYHAQLAWYRDAAHSLGWAPISDAYIVAVETRAPFAVTVMHLGDRALEEGAKLCRLWFERLLSCEAVDEWPSYVQSVVEFEVEEGFGLIIDGEEA